MMLHEIFLENLMPDLIAADRPLLVLIAGPYLSGTDGDHDRIAANRAWLEAAALPITHAAGGREQGDAVFHAYQYPVAERLPTRCDAVLRLPGASRGADRDVARAQALGLPVYHHIDELPVREAGEEAAG